MRQTFPSLLAAPACAAPASVLAQTTDPAAHRVRAQASPAAATADMATGERESWLDREQVDNTTRIELELMLAADANAENLLQQDVVDLIGQFEERGDEFSPERLVGLRYGAFRLTRMIGSGGQGTVYEAERVEGDFSQTVAVKLLRRGIHDRHEYRRFRRERDILVRLDDPGIARLIDGGVSAEGVPYLIMDLVNGEPIDV